jgi:hypothetical protein
MTHPATGDTPVVASTQTLHLTPIEPIPRFTLTIAEAAQAIGVSERHFHTHVKPKLALVPSGRRVLVPITELRDWVERTAIRF